MQLRYDCYAGINYKKRLLRALPENSRVALGDNYFAKGKKKHADMYLEVLEHSKHIDLDIWFLWKNNHKFKIQDRRAALKRLEQLSKRLDGHQERVRISFFLEHNKKQRFMERTYEQAICIDPRFTYINNPCFSFGGQPVKMEGVLNEYHLGEQLPVFPNTPYIISLDGLGSNWNPQPRYTESFMRTQIAHYVSIYQGDQNCKDFGVWEPSCNGKTSLSDSTPPTKRKHFPSKQRIERYEEWYRA